MTYAIDGLLWIFSENILYRYICGNQNKWPIGSFFTWLAYFIWDEVFLNQIMGNIGLSFENQEVDDFLGEDIFSIEIFDITFTLVVIFGGFKIGQQIIEKVYCCLTSNGMCY